ncbi:MAG TPA: GNAT family protein [Chitinophagaceae bacterium]|nr:GNAT family protein [Chitinophagaceae bacterium]
MTEIDYFPVLENERVLLEPLQPTDLEALLPLALHPTLWELALTRITSREDLENYFREAFREREAGLSIPFAVTDKKTGMKAGSTRFGNITPAHRRLEIGWTWLGEDYQRTGLNRWMKLAMLDHAFGTLEVNRVELKTDLLNLKSQNAMLGIGATRDGIFRSHMVSNGGRIRDSIFFSIIRQDWPAARAALCDKLSKFKSDETLAKG